ncbi:MAG: transposase [Bacteroidales bacterium]|nr:transposase [Bacteroidales bacterium]
MKELDDININCGSPKFYRRKDLTVEIRLHIAFMVLLCNKWGIITGIAKRYAISRTFVYMLQSQLNSAIEDSFYVGSAPSKKELVIGEKIKSLEYSLLLRLEGKCSIPAISGILKKMGMKNTSVGTISQNLNQIGKYLPDTFHVDDGTILYVCLAADEMYSYSRPILITVDPVSTAILRIELAESRKTEDWINHFNKLRENGIEVILVVSDEGQGICSAAGSALSGINRQPDTFHAISHRLGKWVNSLERSAYAAIENEYHCLDVFESAKTEQVIQKRMDAYFEAKTNTDKAISLYEMYKFLYHCIIDNLQVFDKHGNPRNRKNAEEDIRVALDYMIGLPVNKIKKDINTIYNLLDELLEYLDTSRQVVQKLIEKGIQPYIVQAFSLAWQHQKNAVKAKKSERRKYFATKEKEQLDMIKMMLGDDFETVKTEVFAQLDKIIQSSAIVENINSIVRAFLNTSRNMINQEILNLIMFYHNHRRYKAGKRKGKTPMELLTGTKQENDWLEMLMEKVEEHDHLSAA